MSRGRAYNIWKTRLKYISRLNKNLYWWRIENGVKYNVFGDKIPRFTRPRNWKELDGGNRHAKLLKKTCALYKDNWKKVAVGAAIAVGVALVCTGFGSLVGFALAADAALFHAGVAVGSYMATGAAYGAIAGAVVGTAASTAAGLVGRY